MRPPSPPRLGKGALEWRRDRVPVTYEIRFTAAAAGRRVARGSVTSEPEAMREAFRAGRARLHLDDGAILEIAIIAHAEGDPTAYFQTP